MRLASQTVILFIHIQKKGFFKRVTNSAMVFIGSPASSDSVGAAYNRVERRHTSQHSTWPRHLHWLRHFNEITCCQNSFELFLCTSTDLFHQAVHFKTCPAVTGCINGADWITPGLRSRDSGWHSGSSDGQTSVGAQCGSTVGVFSTEVRPYNAAAPW